MDLTILRVLMWQFTVGVVLAAVLWIVFGSVAGYSALLGSLTCVIPNAFLGLRIMAPRRDPGALKRAAWIGEMGKLALTVLLFVLVFTQVKPLSPAALFAGFIVTQLVVFSGFLMRSDTDLEN
jgi:ATP synthase protein I